MVKRPLLLLGVIVLGLLLASPSRQTTHARMLVDVEETTLVANSFSYQGRLSENGQPANGSYDFRSSIFATALALVPMAQHESLAVPVDKGLFQLAINVNLAIFSQGGRRFLQIEVRPVGSSSWTALTPRQEILPAPLAIYAEYAGNLSNPGDTVIHVSPFDALESDGQSTLSFAARGTGRLEIRRAAPGDAFVYIPVHVPAQLLGSQLSLKSMRFCYSGELNAGIPVVVGIHRATVRQINDMSGGGNMIGAAYSPPLTASNQCVTVAADTPVAVTGSMWVRFEVAAHHITPLELGQITLTFASGS